MSKKILNNKGFSLVEVVIAIAVTVVVSVAAISIIYASIVSTNKAIIFSEAQYFAADSLECFRASENTEQFLTAMEFRGGYSEYFTDTNIYTFKLDNSGFTAVVTIDYPEDGRASFGITVTDGGGETVSEIQFTKGDR